VIKTALSILLALLLTALPALAQSNGAPGEDQDRNMEDVRDEIAKLKESIQEAYAELLEDSPEASGTVELSFLITPQGAIDDIRVSCDEGLESLEEVMITQAEQLSFDNCAGQEDDIPVTVPFSMLPCQEE